MKVSMIQVSDLNPLSACLLTSIVYLIIDYGRPETTRCRFPVWRPSTFHSQPSIE